MAERSAMTDSLQKATLTLNQHGFFITRTGDANRLAILHSHITVESILLTDTAFRLVERSLDRREFEVGLCLHFKNKIIRLVIYPL